MTASSPELPFTDPRVPGVMIQLSALGTRMQELENRIADALPEDGSALVYMPIPAPRWWRLKGETRTEAVRRLVTWHDQVLRPGYGHLAARVGACWTRHDLALYAMDIASELHSHLYMRAKRSPAALLRQADYQTRLLPALMDQISTETARCGHRTTGASQ